MKDKYGRRLEKPYRTKGICERPTFIEVSDNRINGRQLKGSVVIEVRSE